MGVVHDADVHVAPRSSYVRRGQYGYVGYVRIIRYVETEGIESGAVAQNRSRSLVGRSIGIHVVIVCVGRV
jgi:hypothetical protein